MRSGWVFIGTALVVGFFCVSASPQEHTGLSEAIRLEIPHGEDRIVLVSDQRDKIGDTLYRVTGNVTIALRDMVMTCDAAEYGEESLLLRTIGRTRFRQKKLSLVSSGAEFDFGTQSIIFHDASGYFYDTSGVSDREFFLTGGLVQPINAEKFQVYWGKAKNTWRISGSNSKGD
jgi:hypothetical protein